MSTVTGSHSQDIRAAERWLFSEKEQLGLAKGLFFGRLLIDKLMPYPSLATEENSAVNDALVELREFADQALDPATIDRQAAISQNVIDGLGHLGILGMTAPREFGGLGYTQSAYCRILEEIGSRCAATSIFVNAHHSIGLRALTLFGTAAQKQRWLPSLASGEKIAAFALTEPEAGSDAANVQTRAVPTTDGSAYILNGEKRYITNGAIAQVLTVMARTPIPGSAESEITAFLVTPDMPGFTVIEPRMDKLGVRGTATARLQFQNMRVPKENILGQPGKGLKIALTVLDFGRTTFGACCTGAAKTCLQLAVEHARTRRQFGRRLGEFELVKKKIARMAAWIYAMEAMTYVTAGIIDRGDEDYMLETAMLKVFASEALWTIVNDTFQIYGGAAYFTNQPLERMLRDARLNQIGEGANDVLRSFIALVGMRAPGLELKNVWEALHRPWRQWPILWHYGQAQSASVLTLPTIPVHFPDLQPQAQHLARLLRHFGMTVQRVLRQHREAILERQYIQERIAETAMEILAFACVLSRLDAALASPATNRDKEPWRGAGQYFLITSEQRIRTQLAALHDSQVEDRLTTEVADSALSYRW